MSSRWFFIIALIILFLWLIYIVIHWTPAALPAAIVAIVVAFLILLGLKQP